MEILIIIAVIMMGLFQLRGFLITTQQGHLKSAPLKIQELFVAHPNDIIQSTTNPDCIYIRTLRHTDPNPIYDPVRYDYTMIDKSISVYIGGDWFYKLNDETIINYSKIILNDIKHSKGGSL